MEKNKSILYASKNLISPLENDPFVYSYSGSKLVLSVGGTVSFPIKVGKYYTSTLANYAVWDLFNTGNIFIIPEAFNNITCANDVLPYVYTISMKASQTEDGNQFNRLLDSDVPHNYVMSLDVPTYGKLTLVRYVYEDYNGWLVKIEDVFHISNEENAEVDVAPIKKKLLKEFSINANNLDEYVKKISKSLKSHTNNMKNDQLQINFPETDTISENNNMNISYPVCGHFTINTESVQITSKNYKYANKPRNYASCSHVSVASSEKLVPCAFSSFKDQHRCPYYSAVSQTLKTYNSKDSSIAYSVVKTLTSSGHFTVNIYNTKNNSISYTLLPPADATDDQIIQEVDSIINEVISSWPAEVTDDFQSYSVASETDQAEQKKKSFILSLV